MQPSSAVTEKAFLFLPTHLVRNSGEEVANFLVNLSCNNIYNLKVNILFIKKRKSAGDETGTMACFIKMFQKQNSKFTEIPGSVPCNSLSQLSFPKSRPWISNWPSPQNICIPVQSNNVRLTYFSVNTFFTLTLNIFHMLI